MRDRARRAHMGLAGRLSVLSRASCALEDCS